MNDGELLLLGLLMTQSQHGYQINEFIEKNLSRVTEMKKANAYAILERLSKEGYINVRMEQEGNRPQRKVYTITAIGAAHFIELLRQNLGRADRMTFGGNIGLMYLDHLPQSEAIDLLEEKLAQVKAQIKQYQAAPKHIYGVGVNLALEHSLALLLSEESWLISALARLQSGEVSFNS